MTLSITFYDDIKYHRQDFINRDLDFIGNGVVNLTDFPITYPDPANMTLQLGQGIAWVDGYRIANDNNLVTLTIPSADPTYPRIDIIQIGHDDINQIYSLIVKKGVAASSPIEPGADQNYVKLYAIAVAANATSITSANVTDHRSLVPLKVSGTQIEYAGAATIGANTFTGDQTAPEFVATSQTAPLQLPNLTVLPPTVGPSGTTVLVNNKTFTSDGTNWKADTNFGGFRNLLDPSKQSFTRASNATRKDLTPVPFNVLRTEQGKFGQGAFIEEATTNLVYNSDFETVTGTTTVFNDPLTSGTAWTTQQGSFTYSASGATSGANNSYTQAGNNAWKPLTGSNGATLSLTMQATFTTPSTLSTGDNGRVELFQSSGNFYSANISNTTLWLNKCIGGTVTGLSSNAVTLSASTSYTITLAITPIGGLTAKLYSGTGTVGTLLQTLTATDTSLTGGFLIGVGGDTGVVVSNANVTAPMADGWSTGSISNQNPSLTNSDRVSSSYAIQIVSTGQGSGAAGDFTSTIATLTNGTQYTVSFSAKLISGTSSLHSELFGTSGQANATLTNQWQRFSYQATASTNSTIHFWLNGTGTCLIDAIQVEQKAYATTYVRNDSVSASATRNVDSLNYTLSNPLPSRCFGALVWTPQYASTSGSYSDRTLFWTTNLSTSIWRYLVTYTSGKFNFYKNDGTNTYTCASTSISFNANDRIFIAWEDDPNLASQMTLWVGINSGTLQQFTLSNTVSIMDAQFVSVGNRDGINLSGNGGTGWACNGTIDFPIITDILPTPDQVQVLYQAQDWGGERNYPGSLPNQVSIGQGKISVIPSTNALQVSNPSAGTGIVMSGSKGGFTYLMRNVRYDEDSLNWYQVDNTQESWMMVVGNPPVINHAPAGSTGALQSIWSGANILQTLSGGYKVQTSTNPISATVATAGTAVTVTYTFAVPFSVVPIIDGIAITSASVGDAGYINIRATTISTTSVTFTVNSYVAQTINFNFHASGS